MQNHHKELTQKEIKEYVFERFESVKKSNKAKNLVEFQRLGSKTEAIKIVTDSNRYFKKFGIRPRG